MLPRRAKERMRVFFLRHWIVTTQKEEPWHRGRLSKLPLVAIQQASMKTAQFMSDIGGAVTPTDLRVLYINDGTMLYPSDDGTFAQTLRFSDGHKERTWRVREADNRPWRNYSKVTVERYRGDG